MARKMCPFVTRLQIPVKKELKIEHYREDVGIGFPCIEDKCMAWIPEKKAEKIELCNPGDKDYVYEAGGYPFVKCRKIITIPAHCKLIGTQ